MCFHFEMSHLQVIVYIFSREHKAFLLLPITYQIGFSSDTMTITAVGTLRITMGYLFHQSISYLPDYVMYIPCIFENSTESPYIANFHNKLKLLIHLRETIERTCIIIFEATAAAPTEIFPLSHIEDTITMFLQLKGGFLNADTLGISHLTFMSFPRVA